MKKLLIIVLLSSALSADFIDQRDKQYHIAGTALIGGVSAGIARHYGSSKLEAFAIGLASALVVGIAKEKWDGAGHGTEDVGDIYADTIGGALGSAVSAQLSWSF